MTIDRTASGGRPGGRPTPRRVPSPASAAGPVQARSDAAAALEAAGVEVTDLTDTADARTASVLLDRVWGRSQGAGPIMPPEALVAIAHAGGQVSLARSGDGEAVGATVAFLGRDQTTGTLFLHSHATGVVSWAAGRGIGRALKWYQRAWALQRDIPQVRWTFDPLVRRNAILNMTLLGAQVSAYHQDLYGRVGDERNRDAPTDRVEAHWDLLSPRVRAAAAGRAASPDVTALRSTGATVVLDIGVDGDPVALGGTAPMRLARIPADIEHLRRTVPDQAAAWTGALRQVLAPALADGARISGISRDGWWVVAAPRGVSELAGAG